VVLVRLALALSLVGSATLTAASPAAGILSGYSLTSWNDGAGRPLGSVYAIAQSDDGYLWIGADAGLLRFDGWRFFLWDSLSDTPILGSVTTLTGARGGGLWVGSANPASIGRIHDERVQRYDTGLEGLESVTAVVEEGGGSLLELVECFLYYF
jgi:ligand-binding sensor domain-containing protein